MIQPLISKRKTLKIGHSNYVLIPAYWPHSSAKAVIVEVYDDKVIITPAKR